MAEYEKIFRACDIRGIVPDELDESVAEAVGAAFARLTDAAAVVTVHEMRTSPPGSARPTCSTTPAAASTYLAP